MSAVILGAVEPWVFRPTVVEECRQDPWEEWEESCGKPARMFAPRHEVRERTVPPVVPSFDEPCPEPAWVLEDGSERHFDNCLTCNGTGVVQRVWRAERQRRILAVSPLSPWEPDEPPSSGGSGIEQRLAVVAWYPVTVLRDMLVDEDGVAWAWLDPNAAGKTITPGCTVVIPGDEVRLAEPITTMVCEFCRGVVKTHPFERCTGCQGHLSVPLALEDGLNVVELAR